MVASQHICRPGARAGCREEDPPLSDSYENTEDTQDRPERENVHSSTPAAGTTEQSAAGPLTSGSTRGDRPDDERYEQSRTDDTVSLLDLVAVLAKRWKLIFFATFFAAIGVVLFSIYTLRLPAESPYNPLPNFYQPEAQILLSDPDSGSGISSSLGNSELGLLAGLANMGGQGESSAALAQELLRGNALVDQIVDEFALLEAFSDSEAPLSAARSSIRENLTAEFDGSSGILTVSYEHIDPVFATDVLQRLVTILESRFTFLTRDSARARTEALEQQLQQLEDELQQARDALTSFQRRYGVIDPEFQSQQAIDLIAEFRRQKFELELEREQVLELVQDPADPQIQRINQSIARIEQLITELQTGYQLYSPLSIPLDQIGPLSVQFADLQRDLALKQQVYSTFQLELIRARVQTQDTTRRFQVIEPPEVPELKAGPSRGMISIIVTITAFFLAVFLAFVLEYFARAKQDPEEARKIELIKDQFRVRKRS